MTKIVLSLLYLSSTFPLSLAECMPPSSSYNWLCALYTATKILSIVARRKAARCAPECLTTAERRRHVDLAMGTLGSGRIFDIKGREDARFETPQNYVKRVDDVNIRPASVPYQAELNAKFDISQPPPPITDEPPNIVTEVEAIEKVVDSPVPELPPSTSESIMVSSPSPMPVHTRSLQSSKVPSSPIGRLFHYGGLFLFPFCYAIIFHHTFSRAGCFAGLWSSSRVSPSYEQRFWWSQGFTYYDWSQHSEACVEIVTDARSSPQNRAVS